MLRPLRRVPLATVLILASATCATARPRTAPMPGVAVGGLPSDRENGSAPERGAVPAPDAGAPDFAELAPAQLREVVTRNRPGLQRCYETAARETNFSETLRFNVEIVISATGVVTRVSVTGPNAPPELTACFEEQVRLWQFPAGGEAMFPLVFSPGDVDAPSRAFVELTADLLSTVVMSHRRELQRCYETDARFAAAIGANMRVAVGASGSVTRVTVTAPNAPAALITCVEARVRHWVFPAAGEASFSVVFSAPAGVVFAQQPGRDDVRAALWTIQTGVASCGGGQHGIALTAITVDGATGRVSNAVVSGQFADTPVGSCVARAVREASFPRFSAPTFSVSFPFRI